ncbi:hypothetical protein ARMGADRAFT_1032717 [Armillaria gallica]|uniref:Uncharacterized protein n=1 Tax=Armillaria gallica TaxID=47427 RepID=A0A2H3D7R7_ARMGA|nr:hypothetical protein ARMGADRAFT_1032717 [Armillaria gallica]
MPCSRQSIDIDRLHDSIKLFASLQMQSHILAHPVFIGMDWRAGCQVLESLPDLQGRRLGPNLRMRYDGRLEDFLLPHRFIINYDEIPVGIICDTSILVDPGPCVVNYLPDAFLLSIFELTSDFFGQGYPSVPVLSVDVDRDSDWEAPSPTTCFHTSSEALESRKPRAQKRKHHKVSF